MPSPSAKRARLKVAHVITRLDRGGSTDNTLITAILQDRDRFEPWILSGPAAEPEEALTERARRGGIPLLLLRHLGRSVNPLRDLLALAELLSHFRHHRFDIVHTHTSKAGILGRLAAALTRTPLVVHTPHGHVFWGYHGPLFTFLFKAAERFCGRFSSALIALTDEEKDDYVRFGVEKAGRICVIPSGIERTRYARTEGPQARARLGLSPLEFALVTVARFEPVKNHAILLEVASILQSRGVAFTWHFFGDGPLFESFRHTARARGLDPFFRYGGWRADIPDLLPAFDLFVLCSLNEGMGRVFVEAQASGLPVVASDICGIRSVVGHGATGFLHPPRDAAGLAGSIERLARDTDLRNALGRAARERMTSRFDAETMVRGIERLYLDLKR